MTARAWALFFGFWAAFFAVPAAAQMSDVVATDHARSRLVAESRAGVPGETITLALVQQLDEGWHVYWENPGDTGLPLDLRWELPEGFAASEVRYPLPKRIEIGPLVNFGHEGEPVFLIDLAVPDEAEIGQMAALAVDAKWLICADVCVPESARFSLNLPIAADAGPPTLRYGTMIARAKEAQPGPAPFGAEYYPVDDGPILALRGAPEGEATFFPFSPALIAMAEKPARATDEGVAYFAYTGAFGYERAAPGTLDGVVTIGAGESRVGYLIRAPKAELPADLPIFLEDTVEWENETLGEAELLPSQGSDGTLIIITLGLALLGGIVLNVMPCVFPIVFLKATGFAAVAHEERGVIRRHGLLYTAGVLTAFGALAGVLMALRAGGEQLGWGFHLQHPGAVGVFAVILFAVGLNLAGVFHIGASVQNLGSREAAQGGDAGAFFTGLLAVAVAAPCIGPFLGGAVGAALSQGPALGFAIFLMIGLGLALPYLLLSFMPGLLRLLPKPGPWMVAVKQVFAFVMFAAVIWLVWVLTLQAGADGVAMLGVALLLVGAAALVFGASQTRGHGFLMPVCAALFGVGSLIVAGAIPTAEGSARSTGISAGEIAYDQETLAALRADGQPVFVNFTAAWCITCQVNKRTVLDTTKVKDALARTGTAYMVGDWTSQDPEITKALSDLGRAGVPVYLYYPKGGGEPYLLPQILTVGGVIEVLEG